MYGLGGTATRGDSVSGPTSGTSLLLISWLTATLWPGSKLLSIAKILPCAIKRRVASKVCAGSAPESSTITRSGGRNSSLRIDLRKTCREYSFCIFTDLREWSAQRQHRADSNVLVTYAAFRVGFISELLDIGYEVGHLIASHLVVGIAGCSRRPAIQLADRPCQRASL